MTHRRIWLVTLGAFGLALYLWPALVAPVVRWSDSELDLAWAQRGVGVWSPVVSPHHPPKPGYILFLRLALAAGPVGGAERRIVLIQSLLVWLSIGFAALLVERKVGSALAAGLYVGLVLVLRLRDASSTVMSEALAAALLLAIAAILLDPPSRWWTAALLGLATATLFLVRPNSGAVALVLAALSLVLSGEPRRTAPLLFGFVTLWGPCWKATAVPDDPFRGMAPAFVTGSLDYGWTPGHAKPDPEPPPFEQVASAVKNWKRTLQEEPVDRGRQLAWRALHGALGTDFYDARWSPFYSRATDWSRRVTPLFLLGAAAVLLVAPFRGRARVPKGLGLVCLLALIAQSLILGALPRLALPFLPAVLLYGVTALPGLVSASRRLAAMTVLASLIGLVAWEPQVLDWEWGRLETAGVRISQAIPRGALPRSVPAVLHLRIAPPLQPSPAELEVLGPAGETLYDSRRDPFGQRPVISIPLPASLLEANQKLEVAISLVARGNYDDFHYLLFPVIPRPWRAEAHREGSSELSPSTGIGQGSLDWWAHSGIPEN